MGNPGYNYDILESVKDIPIDIENEINMFASEFKKDFDVEESNEEYSNDVEWDDNDEWEEDDWDEDDEDDDWDEVEDDE